MELVKLLLLNCAVIFAFRIEINKTLYNLCEIIVYRPTYDVSNLELLNTVLTTTANYEFQVALLFLVTDEHLYMNNVNQEFLFHAKSRNWTNVKLHAYVSRKYTQGGSAPCSLTLTTANHMMTQVPGIVQAEDHYAQIWGSWIRRSLQSRVGLQSQSGSHVILGFSRSFSVLRVKSVEELRDTHFSPPFVSYFVFIDSSGSIRAIKRLCVTGCKLTQQMYQREPIFYGQLDVLIRNLKPIPAFPQLIFDYPTDQQLCSKNNIKFRDVSFCNSYSVLPFVEPADVLNFSLTVGYMQINSKIPFDAIFKGIDSGDFWHSSPTFLLSGEFQPHDVFGYTPIYCSDRHTLEKINILGVLFQSLEVRTWILLVFALICVYHFFRMTSVKKSKEDLLFEIVEMLFQRIIRKRDWCRISLLIGCFFIEFLYLTGTTESIIVPRGIHAPENMLELFQTGHKWYQGTWRKMFSRHWVADYKGRLEKRLLPELIKEGFPGNHFELKRFWVKDIFEEDYESFSQFKCAQRRLLSHQKLAYLVPTSSIGYLKPEYEAAKVILSSREDKDGCHILKKVYRKSVVWNLVYSPYRNILMPVFKRILQQSAIRIYFYNTKKRFYSTAQRQASVKPAKIQLIDVRTVAIFGLLSIGLGTSMIFGTLENIMKLWDVLCMGFAIGFSVAVNFIAGLGELVFKKNVVIRLIKTAKTKWKIQ